MDSLSEATTIVRRHSSGLKNVDTEVSCIVTNTMPKKYIFALIFIFWSLLFQLNHQFYNAISLKMDFSGAPPASVSVQWDSGRGYLDLLTYKKSFKRDEAPTFSYDLPYLKIKKLKIEIVGGPSGAVLQQASLNVLNLKSLDIGAKLGANGTYEIDIPEGFSWQLKPWLVVFQIALAALMTHLVWLVWFYRKTIRQFFSTKTGRFFAILCATSMFVQSFWLLSMWPAATTHDSWVILHQAYSLQLSEWQPLTYALFQLAGINVFGTVGGSALLQWLITNVFFVGVFAYCYHHGVKKRWILPLYILFATSIAVGTFNVQMWKDIPYSLAICFLGFAFFWFKEQKVKKPIFRLRWIPLVFLWFTIILSFRHNGLVFYLILPVAGFFVLHRSDFLKLVCVVGFCFLLFQKIAPYALHFSPVRGSPYHELRTSLAIATHPHFFSENRQEDFDILAEATKLDWEYLKATYPNGWFKIWDNSEVGRMQFTAARGYTDRFNQKFVTKMVLGNPGLFMSSRVHDFFRTIGVETSFSDQKNGLTEYPVMYWGNDTPAEGKVLHGVQIILNSSPTLRQWAYDYDLWARHYENVLSRATFFWGIHWQFVVLLGLLLLGGAGTSAAWSTFPFIASSILIFLPGSEGCWRYYYAIFLSGFMLLPLGVLYVSRRRSQASVKGAADESQS